MNAEDFYFFAGLLVLCCVGYVWSIRGRPIVAMVCAGVGYFTCESLKNMLLIGYTVHTQIGETLVTNSVLANMLAYLSIGIICAGFLALGYASLLFSAERRERPQQRQDGYTIVSTRRRY